LLRPASTTTTFPEALNLVFSPLLERTLVELLMSGLDDDLCSVKVTLKLFFVSCVSPMK